MRFSAKAEAPRPIAGRRSAAAPVRDVASRRRDRRRRRRARRSAGLVIFLLITLLNNGGGVRPAVEPRRPLDRDAQSPTACAPTARAERPPTSASDCRIVGYVNSIQELLDERSSSAPAEPYADLEDRLLHRPDEHRLRRPATSDVGPFYLPSTSTSTSTSASSTSSASRFGRDGRSRSPRRRAARTSHGHHVRGPAGASGAGLRAADAQSRRSAPSSRRTAWPACGRTTPRDRLPDGHHGRTTSPTGSTRRRPSVTTGPAGRRRASIDPESWTHGAVEPAAALVRGRLPAGRQPRRPATPAESSSPRPSRGSGRARRRARRSPR